MGHLRLGRLPRTYRWKQVIALLVEGADLPAITEASFHASLTGLGRVPDDQGFCTVLTNIFEFVEAARSSDFISELQQRGFLVAGDASLLDLAASLRTKTDRDITISQAKSDACELAQNAFIEVFLSKSSVGQPSLFQITAGDVHTQLRKDVKGKAFAALMHEFYASFTHRYLTYYLSRELPGHVGRGKYFENTQSHRQFNDALNLYIRQTVRIADEFTPGWLGKTIYKGELDRESVTRYAHVAFKKIAGEFKRGGEGNG